MAMFKCRDCGKQFERTGSCDQCNSPLEKCCPVCGMGIDNCTCTGDVPQTKGHAPR